MSTHTRRGDAGDDGAAGVDADDYPLENHDVSLAYRIQGPFGRCPNCGSVTWTPHRCNAILAHDDDGSPRICGKDLTNATLSTAGNDGFRG